MENRILTNVTMAMQIIPNRTDPCILSMNKDVGNHADHEVYFKQFNKRRKEMKEGGL